jgi:hypothetical protein
MRKFMASQVAAVRGFQFAWFKTFGQFKRFGGAFSSTLGLLLGEVSAYEFTSISVSSYICFGKVPEIV